MIAILLVLLFISSNIVYTQDNNQNGKRASNAEEIKKDPNAKFRTDTVSFAITTSLLGAGYFEGDAGILSQTSLEIFAGTPANNSYIYLSYDSIGVSSN